MFVFIFRLIKNSLAAYIIEMAPYILLIYLLLLYLVILSLWRCGGSLSAFFHLPFFPWLSLKDKIKITNNKFHKHICFYWTKLWWNLTASEVEWLVNYPPKLAVKRGVKTYKQALIEVIFYSQLAQGTNIWKYSTDAKYFLLWNQSE